MHEIALYLLALSMIFLMPGADMILLLQTGSRQGRTAALFTALGLAVARASHIILTALGLATMFKVFPWTFDVVKYAGAAYLFWMGLKMFSYSSSASPGEPGSKASADDRSASSSLKAAFLRGLMTNLLNPKALIFCSVLLPQFIDPSKQSVTAQFAFLGVVLVVTGLVFDTVYATASAWMSQWLEKSLTAQRVQQWLFGTLLIGFAIRLAFVHQSGEGAARFHLALLN